MEAMEVESSISDWLPSLPEPAVMLKFARATMAVQTAWESREHEPCEPVASMQKIDGVTSFEFPRFEGDDLVLRFAEDWSLVIVYDHESAKGPWRHPDRAPSLWPELLQGFPDRLREWLKTSHDDEGVLAATAVAWHLGEAWIGGEDIQTDVDIILEYDDGVASLLDPFIGGVVQLANELNHYYELDLKLDVVQQLAKGTQLARSTVEILCPLGGPAFVEQIERLGYRVVGD